MSRADELIRLRNHDGTYRWERRGEPSVEIVTSGPWRHHLVYYTGGRRLCDLSPRNYWWMWRARRAALRWVEAQRREPQTSVVK